MRRLLHLCGALMLVVLLCNSVGAHAGEALECVEISSETANHFDGDRDQTPSDPGNATPHHHAGCHGHHVAVPSDGDSAARILVVPQSLGFRPDRSTAGCDPGTGLRPPIA